MTKIRIGLFGFGKTGKQVAGEFLNDKHFELVWVVRRNETDLGKYASHLLGHEFKAGKLFSVNDIGPDFYRKNPVDVLVDFSSSDGIQYYEAAAEQGIKIISAISKYEEQDFQLLEKLKSKTAMLYSPNITLGVNFLLIASQVLQKIAPHADIEIVEEHFRKKNETSGTALKIAETLGLEKDKHVNSIRVGGIVGKHEVIFGLPNQTIRIIHESISRAAFGQGAIFAAKWLIEQAAGLYNMENYITDLFRRNIPVY
ncbi:4-hydroxy-tetrahydrodipicolinate reductase [Pinibacter soli]|uniref:4-hydroxy-tetrahydrodipicolinate reductase n=1 Tax=Pinibacter soli TaxID=3044211 RepID=A0ABT6R808_9BACT|nr:dihydrodipicolinate reductase C-terminal domain-containing protein [Pinibacter soli]MDI3318695.1 dihydrodipicolinate reductase C-terminal domain-containing protein [Pinibacter soli]